MKTSMAASIACGRSASGAVAASTTARTTTAAMVLASCERVPEAVAVLGGLASTGNAPISPAATLPAPMPIRSRLTLPASAAPVAGDRTVAAVGAMAAYLSPMERRSRR